MVSAAGVEVDPDKVEAVRGWPTPKSKADRKAFLGLAGYHRKFVPNLADVAAKSLSNGMTTVKQPSTL